MSREMQNLAYEIKVKKDKIRKLVHENKINEAMAEKEELKEMSDEELNEIDSLLSDSLDLINSKCESEKVLLLLSEILIGISVEAVSEMVDRRG